MPSSDTANPGFELARFLPYLLNQAAERVGASFEPAYRDKYGLSRTQWRILAHLGDYGPMTAASVSRKTQTEKSKISRAVTGLSDRSLIKRAPGRADRRTELLALSGTGKSLYAKIASEAAAFDHVLRQRLGAEQAKLFEQLLRDLAGIYDVSAA